MNYTEIKQDLFTMDDRYALAHCISQDYALGKGIAKTFATRFPTMKRVLQEKHTAIGHIAVFKQDDRAILNIVTKEYYWQKPTRQSFDFAMQSLRRVCLNKGITHLAMPKIGSGLDRLSWTTNRQVIQDTFKDTDIEIVVCEL